MLRHYFQIAWRNLLKRKFYSLINVTGLAIGMACCVLITLYIFHEKSYDQYHIKKDRIYRVTQVFGGTENWANPSPKDYQVWGCAPLGPALQADFPEIEKVVQFMSPSSMLLQRGEKRFQQDNLPIIFNWRPVEIIPGLSLPIAPNRWSSMKPRQSCMDIPTLLMP